MKEAWQAFWRSVARLFTTTDYLLAAGEKQAIRLDEYSERELLEARKRHAKALSDLDQELGLVEHIPSKSKAAA